MGKTFWAVIIGLTILFGGMIYFGYQDSRHQAAYDSQHCTKWVTEKTKGWFTYCAEYDGTKGEPK